MGGLLGLLLGTEGVALAFPEQTLSTDYYIASTRTGFDPSQYSFFEIVDRMMPLVESAIVDAGGSVNGSTYTLPPVALDGLSASGDNPRSRVHRASLNNQLGSGALTVELIGYLDAYLPSAPMAAIADGLEFDYSGIDRRLEVRDIAAYPNQPLEERCIVVKADDEPIALGVTWQEPRSLAGVNVVEGRMVYGGGYWQDPIVEAYLDGAWQAVNLANEFVPNPEQMFEIHELLFETSVQATGVRVRESAPHTGSCRGRLRGVRGVRCHRSGPGCAGRSSGNEFENRELPRFYHWHFRTGAGRPGLHAGTEIRCTNRNTGPSHKAALRQSLS
jgi:hypothetical protein